MREKMRGELGPVPRRNGAELLHVWRNARQNHGDKPGRQRAD